MRIRAFGPLTIEVNEAPVRMTGKVQRKPLEVLKALLTSRHGLDAAMLMDMLSPELDGDAARYAFDLAVHRLRKLLQCKDAVLSVQGKLALNLDRVWVDVFELGRILDTEVEQKTCSERLESALKLYAAPLLEGDDTPWVANARHRARGVYVQVVESLTDKLAETGAWDLIKGYCRRAIQIEPQEEVLRRALLRSLHALGQEPGTAASFSLRVHQNSNDGGHG